MPAWYLVVTFAVFPASFLVAYVIGSFMARNASDETFDWYTRSGSTWVVILGGLIFFGMLFYASQHY